MTATRRKRGEPTPGESFWERLDTPTRVLLAIVGIVGGVVAGVASGAAFFSHGKTKTVIVAPASPAPPGRGEHLALCMLRHHLRAPRISVGVAPYGIAFPENRAVFKRCDWPPLTASSADGYTEVRVRNRDLPKGNAEPYNTVAIFRAPGCDRVDVTFVLDHMFVRQFTNGRLAGGHLYQVMGNPGGRVAVRELNRVPSDVTSIVPLPNESPLSFYVLYSGHFALFDAHCASGRPS
jgi:hypothetical protein